MTKFVHNKTWTVSIQCDFDCPHCGKSHNQKIEDVETTTTSMLGFSDSSKIRFVCGCGAEIDLRWDVEISNHIFSSQVSAEDAVLAGPNQLQLFT